MSVSVEELVKRQVPLSYLVRYLGGDQNDIVMKLAPCEREEFVWSEVSGVIRGERVGALIEQSHIFSVLYAKRPEMFQERLDHDVVVKEWIDGIVYDVPDVCRKSKRALKTQKHMREVITSKTFLSHDFLLFLAFYFNTSIYVLNVLSKDVTAYHIAHVTNSDDFLCLLDINSHYERFDADRAPTPTAVIKKIT